MTKQEILKAKRAALLSKISKDPDGASLLASRKKKDVSADSNLEVVKQVSWLIGKLSASFESLTDKSEERIAEMSKAFSSEVGRVEKALKVIADGNKDNEAIAELREVKSSLKILASKKIPAPVVNVAAPHVEVKAPEARVEVIDKTEVVHETKYQEAAAKTLESLSEVLQRIAKNTTGRQISYIENRSPNEFIPVMLVDKRGKNFMDISDMVQAFMSTSSGGGSHQYQEGQVDTSMVGTMMMWEGASDTAYTASTANPLPVAIISGASGGMVDDAAFTVGVSSFSPVGGTYTSTRDSVNDGDGGAFAMTPKRGQYVTLETPDGDSVMDDTLNICKVGIYDGAGAQITTFGGGVQYTEGDVDVSITGTAMMWEDAGNTLAPVSAAKPLPSTVISSALPSGASTAANQATIIAYIDGIEGLLTTIDADTSTLAAIDFATGADIAPLALESGGNLAAIAASASVLDDWDETNRAAVNIIAGQVGVQGGSGTANALTQRVVLATDVALPPSTNTALTGAAPATTSVGTSSASAVASNANRKGLTLVNLSNSYIYLAFSGETAVVGSGLALAPNGGSYEMSPMTFTTGAINAIADLASSTLGIQQWT